VNTNQQPNRIENLGGLRRHLVYRTATYRTTWKLRLGLLGSLLILVVFTRGSWVPAIGWGLVRDSGPCKPDLILIDNLEPDYLLFEKAEELRRIDGAGMVLVPVKASGEHPGKPDRVPGEVAGVMIRVSRLQSTEILPIAEIEPITLNAARQVGEFLRSKPGIRSVLVVTDGFRSRRTYLTYSHVLGKLGVVVYTFPVWGIERPENWATTWHGRQKVGLQYLKLLYYYIFVF
jgi:hypothetical protein